MQTERVSSNMGEQKTHRLNLQTGKYDNSEFPSLKKKKTIHVPRHPTACLCTVRKPACLSHYTTASQRGFEHVGILASKISLDGKWWTWNRWNRWCPYYIHTLRNPGFKLFINLSPQLGMTLERKSISPSNYPNTLNHLQESNPSGYIGDSAILFNKVPRDWPHQGFYGMYLRMCILAKINFHPTSPKYVSLKFPNKVKYVRRFKMFLDLLTYPQHTLL